MGRHVADKGKNKPAARSSHDALLDDPGNEDPGSQLDAPVPLRPSPKAQRKNRPLPSDDKSR